jgi:hypothetical protein
MRGEKNGAQEWSRKERCIGKLDDTLCKNIEKLGQPFWKMDEVYLKGPGYGGNIDVDYKFLIQFHLFATREFSCTRVV